MFSNIETFADEQLSLLELEREAELEQLQSLRDNIKPAELQAKGLCLTKLRVRDASTGLYGRSIISFSQGTEKKPRSLPSSSFGPGDIVSLQSQADTPSRVTATGMVVKLTDTAINVAFEQDVDYDWNEQFQITKLINDVTYRRLKGTLNILKKNDKLTSEHMKKVLFGLMPPCKPLTHLAHDKVTWFNNKLNDCQKEAVIFALNQPEVGIVHGPPGTGKTTTVIEIILQAVKRMNFKVLVCAPSNIAVDNLVQKLAKSDIKIIRLGHPGRTLPEVQELTLDATILHSDASLVVRGVREDMSNIQKKIQKSKSKGEVASLRREMHQLQKELHYRENRAIKEVLTAANVILSTTTSASLEGPLKHLTEHDFDLVIIDEAAQALEASCWIPLLQGQSCILAGDHFQLPPTIISHEAARKGLEVTLMERITKNLGDQVTRMLTTQYRMHQNIMQWPSDQLYGGKLVADSSVQKHLLCDISGVASTEDSTVPIIFIDTAGCHLNELETEESESKGNEGEVDLVEKHIDSLIQAGVNQRDVGVITPYNLQVELIRTRLHVRYPHLEIRSVDGFQGREKEAIVISLVRSNDKGEIGFLAEDRRMNVAITRARRHLAVIGDSETISRHAFLKSFYDFVRENGEVRSAAQYSSINPSEVVQSDAKAECEELNMVFASPSATDFLSSRGGSKSEDVLNRQQRKKKEGSKIQKPGTGNSKQEQLNSQSSQDVNLTEISSKLQAFLEQTDQTELRFPSSLTPKERAYVHEIAESMGLEHVSCGEGASRYITVRHKVEKEMKEEISTAEDLFQEEIVAESSGLSEYQTNRCPNCAKDIPCTNFDLHTLRCHPLEKKPQEDRTGEHIAMHDTVKKGHKNKTGQNKKPKSVKCQDAAADTNEDFDALIASFTRQDSRCFHQKCKASVQTLGQKCQFCCHMFCLKHYMAEIHGCGDAVRAHAKAESRKAFYNPPRKPLKEAQRNHIKSKLDKKLEDMTKQRKGPGKKKDSS